MKYLIAIISLILITFISILIFSISMNKDKALKTNVKISSVMMIVTLPIISLVGSTLFLAFKLIETLLKLNIETFNIFLISIIGVFIIFICDLISKKIIGEVVPVIFAKKYENQNLTESDMLKIIQDSQKKLNICTLLIIFFVSLLLYMLAMKSISVDFTLMFLVMISCINLLSYKIFFRISPKEQSN